jgi:hypothetical protein
LEENVAEAVKAILVAECVKHFGAAAKVAEIVQSAAILVAECVKHFGGRKVFLAFPESLGGFRYIKSTCPQAFRRSKGIFGTPRKP